MDGDAPEQERPGLSKQELFGEIRALCHQKFDDNTWLRLCMFLDAWPDPESMRQEVVPYLRTALAKVEFDPEERALFAQDDWVRRAIDGEDVPQLAVSRGADVPVSFLIERGGLARALPHMKHLEHLDFNAFESRTEPFLSLFEFTDFPSLTGLGINWAEFEERGARYLSMSEGLKNLRRLDLCGCYIGPRGLAILLDAPWFGNLDWLSIEWNKLGEDGARVLRDASVLENIITLDVEHNDLDDLGIEHLARASLPSLEHLDLNLNGFHDRGLIALAESPILEHLISIDLSFNHWGDDGLTALAQTPYLRALEKLRACSADATAEGFDALADADWLDGLEAIDVAFTQDIPSKTWSRLFSRQGMRTLKTLEMDECHLGDEAAGEVLASLSATSLRKLDMRDNQMGVRAMRAIANNPAFENLIDLYLKDNPLGDDGVDALANAPLMHSLQHLHLTNTGLGGAGLEALVAQADARALHTLHLGQNPLTQEDLELLVGWIGMDGVRNLSLEKLEFSAGHLRALLERCQMTMQSLDLESCALDASHMQVLCEIEMPMLLTLDMTNVALQDKDLEVLSKSSNLERLSALTLPKDSFSEKARERFLQNPRLSAQVRARLFS